MRTAKKHRIAVVAVLAMMLLSALTTATAKQHDSDEQNRRKAEYIYMEALRQEALDSSDAYFELLNRAYALDPSSTDIGFFLGYYKLIMSNQDSVLANEGYGLMRQHFAKSPDDFFASHFFGSVSEKLHNYATALNVWATLDSIYPEKSDIAFKHADALTATGDSANLKKALSIYNRVETAEGKSVTISSHKMKAMLAMRDTVAVFKELEDLLQSSPRSSEYSVFAGDLHAMFQHDDSAVYYYDRACRLDSANGLAYYSKANYFNQQGDSVAYDREVFNALKQESLDLPTKLGLMTNYIKALYNDTTQHERIEDLFGVLIEQHPHEVDIHDLYSAYLSAIGDYASAAEQTKYAADIDPSDEDRWRMLMSLYGQSENYEMSITEGLNALAYHPQSVMLSFYLALNYTADEQYDKAYEYYDRALSLTEPDDLTMQSKILCSIGDTHYQCGQADSAFVYYDKAINADPGNLLALNNCAYYLACENKELERAEKMSALTIREEPENDTSLDTYAWVLFKMKRYNDARYYIDEAFKYSSEPSAELYHHAGDIYFFATGNADESLPFWEKALELDPDNELLQRKVKHQTYFSK